MIPIRNNTPSKIGLTVAFTVICFGIGGVLGHVQGIASYKYKTPIASNETRIFAHLCSKNNQWKEAKHVWYKATNTFNVECNDGAEFLNITIEINDNLKTMESK